VKVKVNKACSMNVAIGAPSSASRNESGRFSSVSYAACRYGRCSCGHDYRFTTASM
jgi:hypothetical protein